MEKEQSDNMYKSTFYTSLGTSFTLAGQLISVFILARVLTEQDYGLYTVILVIVNLFAIIAGLGIENGLVKFVASDRQRANKMLLASLFIRSFSFVLLSFIFIGILFFNPVIFSINLNKFIILILLISFFTLQRDTLLRTLQALFDFRIFALNQMITSSMRVVVLLLIIYSSLLTINTLLMIEILIPFISSLILLFNLVRKHSIRFKNFDKQDLKELLTFSLPLYFNNFFNFLFGRVNVLILAAKLNPVSAAFYDISTKIPDAIKKLFDSYITVFYPRQAKNFSENEISGVSSILERSNIIFPWLISVIIVVVFIADKFIIRITFSEKYIAAAPALIILIIALFFRVSANLKGYSIVACGMTRVPMYVNFSSTAIGLLVVFLTIEKLSFLGAALGVLLINIMADILYTLVIKNLKFYKITMFYQLLFGISFIIALFFKFSYENILLNIIIALSLFTIFTTIFRTILKNEIKNIYSLIPSNKNKLILKK